MQTQLHTYKMKQKPSAVTSNQSVTANCRFHHTFSSPAEDSLFNIYLSWFYIHCFSF